MAVTCAQVQDFFKKAGVEVVIRPVCSVSSSEVTRRIADVDASSTAEPSSTSNGELRIESLRPRTVPAGEPRTIFIKVDGAAGPELELRVRNGGKFTAVKSIEWHAGLGRCRLPATLVEGESIVEVVRAEPGGGHTRATEPIRVLAAAM